jgi:hypothetical protein
MAELFLNNLLDADAPLCDGPTRHFVSKALPNCAQERQMLILLFDPRGRKEVEDVLMILRANRVHRLLHFGLRYVGVFGLSRTGRTTFASVNVFDRAIAERQCDDALGFSCQLRI